MRAGALLGGLVALSLIVSGCRQDISSGAVGIGAPAAYPTGDAVDVYRVAMAEILKGGQPRRGQIVVADHTSSWSAYGSDQAAKIWSRRAKGVPLDSALLANVIAGDGVVALRPDFLVGEKVALISKEEMRSLEKRGEVLIQEAMKAHRPIDIIAFWPAFYEAHPGSPGLITLSRVGFNPGHTQAAIDYTIGCGSLCVTGGFMILTRTSRGWVVANNSVQWVS